MSRSLNPLVLVGGREDGAVATLAAPRQCLLAGGANIADIHLVQGNEMRLIDALCEVAQAA